MGSGAVRGDELQQLVVTLREVTVSLLQGVLIAEVKWKHGVWGYAQCRLA